MLWAPCRTLIKIEEDAMRLRKLRSYFRPEIQLTKYSHIFAVRWRHALGRGSLVDVSKLGETGSFSTHYYYCLLLLCVLWTAIYLSNRIMYTCDVSTAALHCA